MDLETVASHFKGAIKAGSGYNVLCPAHKEKNPSLHIEEGENGRIIMKCFAGCENKNIVKAAGLAMKDLFPGKDVPTPSKPKTIPQRVNANSLDFNNYSELPCTLDNYASMKRLDVDFLESVGVTNNNGRGVKIVYYDKEGSQTAVRKRKALVKGEIKRFSWQPGAKTSLYGLERLKDYNVEDGIVLVEGESDCHTLWSQGIPAVGIPGVSNWKVVNNANPLENFKTIYLVIETDGGGEALAQTMKESIIKDQIKLVHLSTNDISELYVSDPVGFKKKLSVFIGEAKGFEDEGVEEKKIIKSQLIVTTAEFSKIPVLPKVSFLNPWLQNDSISLVYGARGCGKSWYALGVLDAVSGGKSFLGWECAQAVPCLYLDGEMTIYDNQLRINELRLYKKRQCPLYIYSDARQVEDGGVKASLANPLWRAEMKSILLEKGIKLWVVDNLASLSPGIDEISKQDWDPINQWFLDLRFAGIASILIHHPGKGGDQRGTSAREDNIDVTINLIRTGGAEDGARVKTVFTKNRNVNSTDLSKIRDREIHLCLDENKKLGWMQVENKANNKKLVLEMLDEGVKNREISDKLKISKSAVSQIKKEALNNGLLDFRDKLTIKGNKVIGKNEWEL